MLKQKEFQMIVNSLNQIINSTRFKIVISRKLI